MLRTIIPTTPRETYFRIVSSLNGTLSDSNLLKEMMQFTDGPRGIARLMLFGGGWTIDRVVAAAGGTNWTVASIRSLMREYSDLISQEERLRHRLGAEGLPEEERAKLGHNYQAITGTPYVPGQIPGHDVIRQNSC